MKRFFTIILSIIFLSGIMVQETKAQNLAKGLAGLNIQTGSGGSGTALILGGAYERAFTDNLSGSFQVDGLIGFGSFSSMFYLSPDVKYFITDEAFNGFYAGGYFGLGAGSNFLYINVGPTGGYMLPLGNNLVLDLFARIGYGSVSFDTGFFGGRVSSGGMHLALGAAVGFGF